MKALVYTQYGNADVLRFEEVAKPAPKEGEVLIKVEAVAINSADWRLLSADPFFARFDTGLRKPKNPILGGDVAGRVEAVGPNVTQFKRGDAVFGDLSSAGRRGLAEFVTAPQTMLALKPVNLSFEEAAAVPMAAVTALQGLRDNGHIQSGQDVLIHGASGGVGTFAVQIAKSVGANVTAVCSTRHVDTARSLGADHVIDYTREDFTKNRQRYDLIMATNGNRSLSDYRRALKPKGTYVAAGGTMKQIFQGLLLGPLMSKLTGKTMGTLMAKPSQKDLNIVKGMLEAGNLVVVIDRCVPFSEAIEAMRYLGEGHARGKVVVSMV